MGVSSLNIVKEEVVEVKDDSRFLMPMRPEVMVQSATLLAQTSDRQFFQFFSLKPRDVIQVIMATERAHSVL